MMTADAGLIIKTGLIIKIKIKMELKQINNGESGLSVRDKINNMFAYLFGLKLKVSDVQGYVPEINDLNDGQSLINTADKRKYTRVGNKMYEQSIAPVVDFKIYLIDAPTAHSPSTGNAIQLSGTKLTGIEMEVENSENINIENANLNINDDSHASITYDLTGNVEESERISFLLSKGDTTVEIEVTVEVEVQLPAVVTDVIPFPDKFFIAGNQQIRIIGENLNRSPVPVASFHVSAYSIELLDTEYDGNEILANVSLPEELLGETLMFAVEYEDGSWSEWTEITFYSES